MLFLLYAVLARVVPFLEGGAALVHLQILVIQNDMGEVIDTQQRDSWCPCRN